MIALDTNVLIRILVDDPGNAKQNTSARNFAQKHKQFFVSQIVQVETAWVLEKAYKFDKESILTVLKELAQNSCFILQRLSSFEQAQQLFSKSNTNFGDCLILVESMTHEAREVVTFDKRFAKLTDVKLLT